METKPKVFKWALIIGIVIVLNLFFNYTISLFYKQPEYNDYFRQQQVVEPITNKDECLKVGGQWVESPVYKDQVQSPTEANLNKANNSYCNPDFTKQQEYNNAEKTYNRNIFIVLAILGVISLAIGAFMTNEIVSLGLSWGGVLSLIIASMRYWSDAGNWLKVLILAIALGVLIWLAIKKFGNKV